MTFQDKLNKIVRKNNSLVCVGLDSDVKTDQFLFNKAIINSTFDLVCSYKLNTAFYEAIGLKGIKALKATCDYLKSKFPTIPVIIDAKRGDIGNTNKGYAKFVFEYLRGDAITVNPYLGEEAIRPFLNHKDRGIIILCRTSNPGAGEFQDLKVKGKPLYQVVAAQVAKKWNKNRNCLLVIGATYTDELRQVREIVGDKMTFLVPGIGTQGGDLQTTLKVGLNSKKQGLIINSSRGIIFAKNPRVEAQKLRDFINGFR
jgi:orotidine 5'-phosphate decarboxylase subfamily 2